MDQSREQIHAGVKQFGVAYLATAHGLDWRYCHALECWGLAIAPETLCPHHLEAAKNASEDGRRKRVQVMVRDSAGRELGGWTTGEDGDHPPGSWGPGQRPE